MEMHLKISGGSEPLRKAIGVGIGQSEHQKLSNFSACKAQGNQHEIRIVFLECDKRTSQLLQKLMKLLPASKNLWSCINPWQY